MSVIATVFHPDGSQIHHMRRTRKGLVPGKPLVYERLTAWEAFLAARRSWWPTDRIGKKASGPEWGNPPIGAEIRLDGEPWLRWEEANVDENGDPVGDDGEIANVVGMWVDIAQRVRDDVKAKKIAAAKAAQAARRAAALAEQVAADTEAPPVIAPVAEDVGVSSGEWSDVLAADELSSGTVTVGNVVRPVAGGPSVSVSPTPDPKPRKNR